MSVRYRKISPRIWTDERFRRLTPEQQRVALYVLTAQSNRIGLFSFSPGKASEDLQVSPPAFRKDFANVCRVLRWEWDDDARVIYLPTWWKYNPIEGANNIIGNLKDLADLPATPLAAKFSINLVYLPDDLKPIFRRELSKWYPNPSPHPLPDPSGTQELELEQEQKQEQEAPSACAGDVLTENQASVAWLVQEWNKIPGVVPANGSLTGPVLKSIRARLVEHPNKNFWLNLFTSEIAVSDFLCGRKTDWAASIDWVCGPKNLSKILSGKYRNRDSQLRETHKSAIGRTLARMAEEKPQ